MGENVLVTGGAGFVGSHLVDALLDCGHAVRVFDSLEPQVHGGLSERGAWPDYLADRCDRTLGDVRDRDALYAAIEGVDVIFHLAAAVGVGQSMYHIERYVDVNTHGTAVLLDILANETHQVRKLIVASSMSVYGEGSYRCAEHGEVYPRLRSAEQLVGQDWELHCPTCAQPLTPLPTREDKPLHPTSIYAITKKDQEEMCLTVGRAYDIPTVALRYFNVYGPRQALSNPYTGVAAIFSARLLNGQPPVIFEDGLQSRDLVHVSDVVQANLLAMDRDAMDHGVFNVGTGRPLSILDLARTLVEQMDSPLRPQIVPRCREGDVRHCYPDVGRLTALGYAPRVRFEQGIAALVSWVRAHQAVDGFQQAQGELASRGLTT